MTTGYVESAKYHLSQRYFSKGLLEAKLRLSDKEEVKPIGAKTLCFSLISWLAGETGKFGSTRTRSYLKKDMKTFINRYRGFDAFEILIEINPKNEYRLPKHRPAGDELGAIIVPENFTTLVGSVNPEQQIHSLIESVACLVNPRISDEEIELRVIEFDKEIDRITQGWKISETQRVAKVLDMGLEIVTPV